MFTVLLAFFDDPIKTCLKELCTRSGQVKIYETNSMVECQLLCERQAFDCFLFSFDKDFATVRNFITNLRQRPHHIHTPMLLFSSKVEYLVSAFVKWHSCEFFLLPLDDEKKESILGLLHFYDRLHQKIHHCQNDFCQIHTSKGMYHLPYREILFAESAMKKSIIHLKAQAICLPVPLYRVKEILNANMFVQTHRSFIVNTDNVSYIDKTKEPWGIFFFNSEKEAFVSRSHKKLLPAYFHAPSDGGIHLGD